MIELTLHDHKFKTQLAAALVDGTGTTYGKVEKRTKKM
jgi:hypothetical protein